MIRHRDVVDIEIGQEPGGFIHPQRGVDLLVAVPVEGDVSPNRFDQVAGQRDRGVAVLRAVPGRPGLEVFLGIVVSAPRREVILHELPQRDRGVSPAIDREEHGPVIPEPRGVRQDHPEGDDGIGIERVDHLEGEVVVDVIVQIEKPPFVELHQGSAGGGFRNRSQQEDGRVGHLDPLIDVGEPVTSCPDDLSLSDDAGRKPGDGLEIPG